jgi:hypothetical protein
MEKSYKELITFLGMASAYISKQKGAETKMTHSLRKIIKQVNIHLEDYNEKLNDHRIAFCSTDPQTNIILKDQHRELQFTKENQKLFNNAARSLMNTKVQIDPQILPENNSFKTSLTFDEIEIFTGYVIQ